VVALRRRPLPDELRQALDLGLEVGDPLGGALLLLGVVPPVRGLLVDAAAREPVAVEEPLGLAVARRAHLDHRHHCPRGAAPLDLGAR